MPESPKLLRKRSGSIREDVKDIQESLAEHGVTDVEPRDPINRVSFQLDLDRIPPVESREGDLGRPTSARGATSGFSVGLFARLKSEERLPQSARKRRTRSGSYKERAGKQQRKAELTGSSSSASSVSEVEESPEVKFSPRGVG